MHDPHVMPAPYCQVQLVIMHSKAAYYSNYTTMQRSNIAQFKCTHFFKLTVNRNCQPVHASIILSRESLYQALVKEFLKSHCHSPECYKTGMHIEIKSSSVCGGEGGGMLSIKSFGWHCLETTTRNCHIVQFQFK